MTGVLFPAVDVISVTAELNANLRSLGVIQLAFCSFERKSCLANASGVKISAMAVRKTKVKN